MPTSYTVLPKEYHLASPIRYSNSRAARAGARAGTRVFPHELVNGILGFPTDEDII